MATIASLIRIKDQPAVTRTGNTLTGSEQWQLLVTGGSLGNGGATQWEAENLIANLSDGNVYGFMEVGVTPHPNNSGVKSVGYTVERDIANATNQFKINCDLTNDNQRIQVSRKAIHAPARYSFQNVDTLLEVDIDPITGKGIAASNGEPYFPKLQRKGSDKRIIITRNEPNYNPNTAALYENKINSVPIKIRNRYYPARTILFESWTA